MCEKLNHVFVVDLEKGLHLDLPFLKVGSRQLRRLMNNIGLRDVDVGGSSSGGDDRNAIHLGSCGSAKWLNICISSLFFLITNFFMSFRVSCSRNRCS